jgi:hypothetical protein
MLTVTDITVQVLQADEGLWTQCRIDIPCGTCCGPQCQCSALDAARALGEQASAHRQESDEKDYKSDFRGFT